MLETMVLPTESIVDKALLDKAHEMGARVRAMSTQNDGQYTEPPPYKLSFGHLKRFGNRSGIPGHLGTVVNSLYAAYDAAVAYFTKDTSE